MFREYITIAYRSITKHKFYSSINLLGLATGTAACLLILHYVHYELSYEDFHQKSEQIYRLTLDSYKDGELQVQDAEMYPLAGLELKEQMPEVLDFVRLHDEQGLVVGTEKYRESEDRMYYTDPSVFSIFSLPLTQGDPTTALDEPFEMVISESKAKQYFGTTEVLGNTLDLYGLGNEQKAAKITGVMKDLPPNTHLKIDFMLSYISLRDEAIDYPIGWNGNNEFTYLLMDPRTNLGEFRQKLDVLAASLEDKLGEERFNVQPISDIHLYSNKTYEPEANGNANTVYFLSVIALFILIIAWVNYINLATARSVERAKEVGVKKAVGCSRSQLIQQFLFESFSINVLAMILAVMIVYLSFAAFRELSGQPLSIRLFTDSYFILVIVALLLVGTLLSGLYPALVLSSFRPVAVMKGKLKNTTHGRWLRQGLVVFQFLASVVLMVGTFTVYQQLEYMQEQELGIDTEQVMVVKMPLELQYDPEIATKLTSLQQEWKRLSSIEQVAGAQSVPGTGYTLLSSSMGIRTEGQDESGNNFTYYHYGIDDGLISTLGIELLAGQNFRPGVDNERKAILNEEAIRLLGFKSPEEAVGQKITFDSVTTIVGVVRDYNYLSLKEPVVPFIHWYSELNAHQYIRLGTQNPPETIGQIESTFESIFPGSTLSYFFLDDKFNQQYQAEARFGQVFGLFAGLAILVACLGLLGLSSYTSIQRTKEIGIRKALGASVSHIILLLTKSYFRLILIALLIAIPVANYVMGEWLEQFAYRIGINWWLFVVPGILVVLIALLAVSGQTLKSARANPVKALRYE